jgi:hypothetical protein
MSPEQITVAVFFWGSAVVIALDALKQGGLRQRVLWALSAAFVLAGLLVKPLWAVFPDLAGALSNLAFSPTTWFFLAAIAYLTVTKWERGTTSREAPVACDDTLQIGNNDLEERLSNLESLCPDAADKHFWDNNIQAVADHNQRLAMLEASQRAIANDYQNMRGLDARLSGELDGLKETMRTEDDSLRQYLQVLEGKLTKLNEITRHSIHAMWMREQIKALQQGIRKDAADLNHRVSERQQHDRASWDSWESVHAHWTSLTAQWWHIARFYLANSRQVLQAPDHMYPTTQVDEALLTPGGGAEAVRLYKRFCIIQNQWEAAQVELDNNLVLVAFNGMTELDVRHGQALEQA